MSSFIGHATAGAAIYLSQGRLSSPQARWALPLFILLAVFPDFDYVGRWFLGADMQPRVTHTLAFCVAFGILAWVSTTKLRADVRHPPTLAAYVLASSSHLALDILVGVHALPVLWPFTANEISSPIGILPSTIHVLSLTNHYLWRNLLIESAVLLPLLAAMVALCRATPVRSMLPKVLFMGPPWIVCLAWSLGLQR